MNFDNQKLILMIENVEKKIRQIRDIKGISQEYIANKLNLSIRAYSKIENGDTQLTLNRLNEISNALEVSPEDMLGFDVKKIFNNTNQQGGNATITLINQYSEKEREQYEKRILHLESEILFLRTQLEIINNK